MNKQMMRKAGHSEYALIHLYARAYLILYYVVLTLIAGRKKKAQLNHQKQKAQYQNQNAENSGYSDER
jgi:hypothetical protein